MYSGALGLPPLQNHVVACLDKFGQPTRQLTQVSGIDQVTPWKTHFAVDKDTCHSYMRLQESYFIFRHHN